MDKQEHPFLSLDYNLNCTIYVVCDQNEPIHGVKTKKEGEAEASITCRPS